MTMQPSTTDRATIDLVRGVALFVAMLWVVFLIDRALPLERLGLVPRTVAGLTGIVAMPFLHSNLAHLAANTVPLIVLLVMLSISGARALGTSVAIVLLSGTLLWLFGRSANHIGASGLVFGLAAFLIASAWYRRTLAALGVAVLTVVLYGGVLASGVLPFNAAVSWDGHLAGAVAGVLTAALSVTRTGGVPRRTRRN